MVLISAEKSGCIFIPVGARDILSAPVCVCLCTGRFESGHAGSGKAIFEKSKQRENAFSCGLFLMYAFLDVRCEVEYKKPYRVNLYYVREPYL